MPIQLVVLTTTIESPFPFIAPLQGSPERIPHRQLVRIVEQS